MLAEIHKYAAPLNLDFEIEELSYPPPLLQGLCSSPGICLTFREPEPTGEPPAQFGVWLCSWGKAVNHFMMREGDHEIETFAKPIPEDFDTLPFIESLRRRFYMDYVFLPAIEDWSDRAKIGY